MTSRTRTPIWKALTCLTIIISTAVETHALPTFDAFVDSMRDSLSRSFKFTELSDIQDLVRRDDNSTSSNSSSSETDVWVLDTEYAGETFFDGWTFYTGSDPTNGLVDYVDQDTAFNDSLVYVTDNNTVIMKGDDTTWLSSGENRKSVRISSDKYWTGGLFILDLNSAPWGCGTWPAFWALSATATWPAGGEIDILEGVHDNIHNQVTWHTAPGCNLTESGNFTGTPVGQLECDATLNSNAGCGITDWSRVSYGETFDEQGGGVYAMLWDETGISVWYFYRVSIPDDIQDGNPKPKTWTTPSATLAPAACDPFEYFFNHSIIFDITFCGDWAGNTYSTTPGCNGTCQDHLQDPNNFVNASWDINSLKVYQKTELTGSVSSDASSFSQGTFALLASLVTGAAGLALALW